MKKKNFYIVFIEIDAIQKWWSKWKCICDFCGALYSVQCFYMVGFNFNFSTLGSVRKLQEKKPQRIMCISLFKFNDSWYARFNDLKICNFSFLHFEKEEEKNSAIKRMHHIQALMMHQLCAFVPMNNYVWEFIVHVERKEGWWWFRIAVNG